MKRKRTAKFGLLTGTARAAAKKKKKKLMKERRVERKEASSLQKNMTRFTGANPTDRYPCNAKKIFMETLELRLLKSHLLPFTVNGCEGIFFPFLFKDFTCTTIGTQCPFKCQYCYQSRLSWYLCFCY